MSLLSDDPTLGRFLSRDPLGRAPLMWASQPYVYAGNNPLVNVDPGGQREYQEGESAVQQVHAARQAQQKARIQPREGTGCKHPTRDWYATCYGKWEYQQLDKRKSYLSTEFRVASGILAFGYLVGVAVDLSVFFTETSAFQTLVAGLDLLLNFGAGIGYLISAFAGDDSDVGASIAWVLGVIHTCIALIRGTLGLLQKLGALAGTIADVAVVTLKTSVSGLPGVLQRLILFLAGSVANNFLSAGSHAIIAWGGAVMADYTYQMGEDIGFWCSHHPNACSAPPPSPF